MESKFFLKTKHATERDHIRGPVSPLVGVMHTKSRLCCCGIETRCWRIATHCTCYFINFEKASNRALLWSGAQHDSLLMQSHIDYDARDGLHGRRPRGSFAFKLLYLTLCMLDWFRTRLQALGERAWKERGRWSKNNNSRKADTDVNSDVIPPLIRLSTSNNSVWTGNFAYLTENFVSRGPEVSVY